jgi:hypothetical protein
LTDEQWTAIFGTHVLRKLAVYNEMKIDSGYADLLVNMECPCGCNTPINVGDNSIGN